MPGLKMVAIKSSASALTFLPSIQPHILPRVGAALSDLLLMYTMWRKTVCAFPGKVIKGIVVSIFLSLGSFALGKPGAMLRGNSSSPKKRWMWWGTGGLLPAVMWVHLLRSRSPTPVKPSDDYSLVQHFWLQLHETPWARTKPLLNSWATETGT